MWGWIKPLLDSLLAWFERLASKPKTIEDANTPKATKDRWYKYITDKLRNKSGSD